MAGRLRTGLLAGLTGQGLALVCCGGGTGTGPTTPPPTHSVVVTAFYDENGDGVAQPLEVGRVPGVEVEIGGRTATTEKLTGRAVVNGVTDGPQRVTARAATLPAYYEAPATAPSISVPTTGEVMLPVRLSIGSNHPAVYMAFGDSITEGDGSVQHEGGYRSVLEAQLRAHFGQGSLEDEAQSGSKSDVGAERIGLSLNRTRPAYTLILYGTNDYQRPECQPPPCFTVDALRSMIGAARSVDSLPILATIPPVHPELAQPGRNGWVGTMNQFIRPMAQQEKVPLADVYAAFMRVSDLASLFSDRLHPNDRGYEIIAGEFFAAVSRPLGATTTAQGGPRLLLAPPAAPARGRR